MTFKELKNIFEKKFGATKLSDIAYELSVTPQVVNNWKIRNNVPYKYVKVLRKKVKEIDYEGKFDQKTNYINPIHIIESSSGDMDAQNNFDLVGFLKAIIIVFLKKRVLIFSSGFFLSLFTLLIIYYYHFPLFISHAKIVPIEQNQKENINMLANTFGLGSLSKTSISYDSSILLPELINSETLSRRLLVKKFNSENFSSKTSLYKILGFGEEPDTSRENSKFNRAVRLLKNNISINKVNRASPVYKLSVTTIEPFLAKELIHSLIDELSIMQKSFNLKKLNKKQIFIEKRFEEISKKLEAKEDVLTNFRKNNRGIESSPTLLTEEARLIRDVSVQSEIFITLKKQYELAKIEEVEKSGSINIIDKPNVSRHSINEPKTLIIFTLSLLFYILIFCVFIIYYRIYVENYHTRLVGYWKNI